jgi:hypothetical protein
MEANQPLAIEIVAPNNVNYNKAPLIIIEILISVVKKKCAKNAAKAK